MVKKSYWQVVPTVLTESLVLPHHTPEPLGHSESSVFKVGGVSGAHQRTVNCCKETT